MSKKTSFEGAVRSYGGGKKGQVTPSVSVQAVVVSLDSKGTAGTTAVKVGVDPTAGPDFILPKGSIVLDWTQLATTAGAGTVDIGIAGEVDYFFAELDADAVAGVIDAASGGVITENAIDGTEGDHPVLGGEGAVDPTSGNVVGIFRFITFDDGKDSA
jgi:hypothetical protein